MAAYGEDLAYIHHTGFASFSSRSAAGLLAILGRGRRHKGLVIDLGCGSGVWARMLSRAGYPVLGIDRSAAMISLARKNAPRAVFRSGSFLKAKLPRCDAVTALGEVLSYLFDRANGERELFRFFRRVHDALTPGGVFVFDLATPGQVAGPGPTRSYAVGGNWAVLVEKREDKRRCLLTRRIVTFRQVGSLFRRREELHRLHLFRESQVARALRRSGFRVRRLRGYGAVKFRAGVVGFLARKPAAFKAGEVDPLERRAAFD
ncbi:MAG TPA: methyltransferase domain-containing protein [Myxococcaceae bacterium]|nr:methyltransferase domain-containing protein [Myxococcaceae bacterium]